MKLNQKGFGAVEGLLVVIALTLIVGVGYYVVNANKDNQDTTNNTRTSTKAETKPTETKKQYLEFKSAGVKMELNEQTKDAYVGTTSQDDTYISSHYFDDKPAFEGCKVNGQASGIIALSSAKVGDDHFGSPWTEAELKGLSEVKIGDTYYWMTPSNGPCWDPGKTSESDPGVQKLMEFRKAIADQQSTITKL
jgi:hypothetical protein